MKHKVKDTLFANFIRTWTEHLTSSFYKVQGHSEDKYIRFHDLTPSARIYHYQKLNVSQSFQGLLCWEAGPHLNTCFSHENQNLSITKNTAVLELPHVSYLKVLNLREWNLKLRLDTKACWSNLILTPIKRTDRSHAPPVNSDRP
jgi:hypothetical protein